jgi:hypothetical protein
VRGVSASKTKRSLAVKTLKWAAASLFIGFVVVIVIPTFIGARLSKAGNACVNNLRLIKSAKEQWALENHKSASAIPALSDL